MTLKYLGATARFTSPLLPSQRDPSTSAPHNLDLLPCSSDVRLSSTQRPTWTCIVVLVVLPKEKNLPVRRKD